MPCSQYGSNIVSLGIGVDIHQIPRGEGEKGTSGKRLLLVLLIGVVGGTRRVVSEQTREEDERLREELRRVDLNKLKKILKSLLRTTRKKKDS